MSSSRLPPAKRPRRSADDRGSKSSSRQRPRDTNQLTITSLLLREASRRPPQVAGGERGGRKPGTDTNTASSSSSVSKPNTQLTNSNDLVVVLEDDDTPPASGTTMTERTGLRGESCDDDRVKKSPQSRDCSPELFSDPAGDSLESENVDNMADSEGLRGEQAESGSNCDNAAAGGEGEAPGNQDVIEIDDTDESSVREKSVTSIASSSRSNTRSPEIDIPPWDGTPLSEIHFGPSTYPILPPLQSSATHSVLFRPRLKSGQPPTPFPEKFKDVWDANHVRMPCSSQSVYPVATTGSTSASGGASATKTLVPRWDIIKESLKKPIANSYDLEEAILTYNTHYARRWNFYGLHSYFNDHCSEDETRSFFESVLPRVIDLALSLPSLVTHALPLLKKQLDYSVSLSQQQVACLLANAFLCTFPRRNARGVNSEYASYPSINFNTLFNGSAKVGVSPVTANKLTCLFHYFTR